MKMRLSPAAISIEAKTSEVLRDNLCDFDGANSAMLQGIYDKTPSKNLMRSINCA